MYNRFSNNLKELVEYVHEMYNLNNKMIIMIIDEKTQYKSI